MKAIRKDPSDFTMVTRGYWSDLRALSKRMPAAFQVLILITERMNKSNALVISQATLGQMLGYGRTTIHKATKLLEDEKWLQVVKVGTANAYIVNSKVVWRDHSGKRYGSFYAEVLVSEEEQHKTAEQLESVELRNIPVLLQGEKPILSGLPPPPPDQGELLPPDPVEFPRQGIQAELETRGQLRIDLSTGEIIEYPENGSPDPWAHLRGLTPEEIQRLPDDQRAPRFAPGQQRPEV